MSGGESNVVGRVKWVEECGEGGAGEEWSEEGPSH